MKYRIPAAILVTMMFIGTALTQSINKPKLDSLFSVLAQKNKAMGSVTISRNGIILYSRAIGYSYISEKEKKPATVETKYTINKKGSMLIGQATGQSSFPLEATGKDKFEFEQAGIMIQFDSTKNEFTFHQAGGSYLFICVECCRYDQ